MKSDEYIRLDCTLNSFGYNRSQAQKNSGYHDYMLADRFGRIELMSRHRSHYLWVFNPLLSA